MNNLINKITHADCMDIMANIPDGCIDLAIVDPPYGIGQTWNKNKYDSHKNNNKSYKNNFIPDEKYFTELLRISKNYIIWGANYYNFGWPTKNVIVWDKVCKWETQRKAEAEIAITSLTHRPASIYRHQWSGALKGADNGKIKTIHPYQKQVSLYRWLLQNYAKPGQLILDTHSGSGSLACAFHLEKFDFLAIEKDYDYWLSSCKRLEELGAEGTLF